MSSYEELPNVAWAEDKNLTNAQGKATLLALSAFIDLGHSRVSIKLLARASKQSPATVRRHLKRLKKQGFIDITPQCHVDDPSAQGPNLYTLVGAPNG